MNELIDKVKEKREFRELPDSVIETSLLKFNKDIKKTRSFLRKYFGVFLTNKVLKYNNDFDKALKNHISSKKRDYNLLYKRISGNFKSVSLVIDLGCGVNGFSYLYLLKEFGDIHYIGVDAVGQIVKNMNSFFKEKGFEKAKAVSIDLLDTHRLNLLLEEFNSFSPRIIFMFQVIDALESLERDFSKKLILDVSKKCDGIVLSYSLSSLSGKRKFFCNRKWILDYINENFFILDDFEDFGERFIIFRRRN